MDLGKIMIGIALVMLSVGVLVSPSGATACDHSCTVGCGSDLFHRRCHGDPILTTGAGNPRRIPGTDLREYQSWERTMTLPSLPPYVSLGNKPRTRMNDDHSMHIPGISSHRNVNNSRYAGPAPVQSCNGIVRTSSHSRVQGAAIPPVIIHTSQYFFRSAPRRCDDCQPHTIRGSHKRSSDDNLASIHRYHGNGRKRFFMSRVVRF